MFITQPRLANQECRLQQHLTIIETLRERERERGERERERERERESETTRETSILNNCD